MTGRSVTTSLKTKMLGNHSRETVQFMQTKKIDDKTNIMVKINTSMIFTLTLPELVGDYIHNGGIRVRKNESELW